MRNQSIRGRGMSNNKIDEIYASHLEDTLRDMKGPWTIAEIMEYLNYAKEGKLDHYQGRLKDLVWDQKDDPAIMLETLQLITFSTPCRFCNLTFNSTGRFTCKDCKVKLEHDIESIKTMQYASSRPSNWVAPPITLSLESAGGKQ